MRTKIRVRMQPRSPWGDALLTTERTESLYGLPVVVVDGIVHAPSEVWAIHVRHARAAAAASRAGYRLE